MNFNAYKFKFKNIMTRFVHYNYTLYLLNVGRNNFLYNFQNKKQHNTSFLGFSLCSFKEKNSNSSNYVILCKVKFV